LAAPFIGVILAAGLGKRMNSDLPKVLHPALGRPLVAHVLDQIAPLHPLRLIVVVGHRAELVRAALRDRDVHFVTQSPQLGTGHAVQMAWEDGQTGLAAQVSAQRMQEQSRAWSSLEQDLHALVQQLDALSETEGSTGHVRIRLHDREREQGLGL